MSLFSKIMDKIFHRAPKPVAAPTAAPTAAQANAPAQPAPVAPAPEPVDVEKVLAEMAAAKGDPDLNYRTSIVDLLKLLDLDSSLTARKDLAGELGVQAGEHGSAEQNIALQKAVMKKLAENGGKVPAELKD